jgi:hypothetical protein
MNIIDVIKNLAVPKEIRDQMKRRNKNNSRAYKFTPIAKSKRGLLRMNKNDKIK